MQSRLAAACERHCPDATLMFTDGLPDGCAPHDQHQYAFKLAAMKTAIGTGARFILWIDCTFIPLAPIEPLWAAIERDGWYAPQQGNSALGTWTTDAALGEYGIDRDAAMNIQLAYSGLVGLDMHSATGNAIWKGWNDLAHTFNGPHRNEPGSPIRPWGNKFSGHASNDPRVEGHRHDESALSFVLHSLGLMPRTFGFLTLETPTGFIGRNFA